MENNIENTAAEAEATQTEAPAAEQQTEKKQNKFVAAFDKFFKFTERGSSMGKEIWGGVSMFLISICIIFLNVSIIARVTLQNEISISEGTGFYTGIYLITLLCSIVGTLLIGMLCNLPLSQSAGLGLSSAFIAIAGGEGLTFANVLAVSFIAAVIFTAICATPIKKYIMKALPAGVKKVLPVAVGAFIMITFLNFAAGGNVTSGGWSLRNVFTPESYVNNKVGLVCVISVAAAVLTGVILKACTKKGIFRLSLLVGIVLYFILGCILCFNNVVGQDRVFMIIDAYGPAYDIGKGFENASANNFFAMFKSGFDFTAYTAAGGNVALLFIQGILTFLMLGCYDSAAVTSASATHGGYELSDKLLTRTLLINGGTNVLGAMLGATPLSVSTASAASSDDGAKTGLSSVVCCIGLVICLFTWAIPAILASTMGLSVDYGHNEFGVYTQATFNVLFAAGALVGLSMLVKSVRRISLEGKREALVAVMTIAATVISVNLSVGIAVGVIGDMIAKTVSKNIKKITIPQLVVGVILLLCLIFGKFF